MNIITKLYELITKNFNKFLKILTFNHKTLYTNLQFVEIKKTERKYTIS